MTGDRLVQNAGQGLAGHARLRPNAIGACDLDRRHTFARWNERACRLANALAGIGLARGARIAIIAYNRLEWAEIYAAAAKAGMVVVPINFRLNASEMADIVRDCAAEAAIAEAPFVGTVEEVREALLVPPDLVRT